MTLSDAELVARAQAGPNGDIFDALHDGQLEDFDTIQQGLEAYCQILLGEQPEPDSSQIINIIKQSKLGDKIADETIESVVHSLDTDDSELDEFADTWINRCIEEIESYLRSYQENNNGDPNTPELSFHCAELLEEHGSLFTVADTEELWACDPETKIWDNDGKQTVRQILDSSLGPNFRQHLFREVQEKLKARSIVDRDELGTPNGTIAVKNGLLNLESQKIRTLLSRDRATWRLPVTYDPEENCSEFERYLKRVCNNQDIRLLQEYIGYCLHHQNLPHKKALMIFGPTDAGKSVLLDVLTEFFGISNTAGVSPQYLANQRWGPAQLLYRPVNIRHDLDPDRIKKLGKIKEIIAGNRIQAEQKMKEPFEFNPTTKHIFAANQAPERDSDDTAFWNRWLTIVFPERIPREEQDPNLTDKLTTDSELSGLLNWALEGYDRLQKQGKFTNEPTPQENREKWQAYGSSIDRFLYARAQLTGNNSDFLPKGMVYRTYTDFANKENLPVKSQKKFTRELNKRSEITDGKRRIEEDPVDCYMGITLE